MPHQVCMHVEKYIGSCGVTVVKHATHGSVESFDCGTRIRFLKGFQGKLCYMRKNGFAYIILYLFRLSSLTLKELLMEALGGRRHSHFTLILTE